MGRIVLKSKTLDGQEWKGSFVLTEDRKRQLIEQGWIPPPEKSVYEGKIILNYFDKNVTLIDCGDQTTRLVDLFDDFISKHVRITIEELR